MEIKLYNNDCLSDELLKQIPDNSIDIVFTSPPYNLGGSNFFGEWCEKNYKKEAKYKGKSSSDNRNNYAEWLVEFVIKWLDKSEYVFLNLQSLASNKKDIHTMLFLLNDYYCDKIVWWKKAGVPHSINSRVMTATFEEIFIFSKKPNKRVGTKEWFGTVTNHLTMTRKRNQYAHIHKAVFPVELPTYIIENFVKEGGVVADPFMGLGTTGVACKNTNRGFIGIEMDKEYFDIAKERIENESK